MKKNLKNNQIKMKSKIEIKSYFGSILFELECENNSIKNTVLEAIKSDANLRGADLSDANLRRANLSDANLSSADLSGAEHNETTSFFISQCPEGSFIAYKKSHDKIIKLQICEDAKRSSATTLKCRCSKAKCLEIQNLDGSISEL